MNHSFEKIRIYPDNWPNVVYGEKPGNFSMYVPLDWRSDHDKEAYYPILHPPKLWPEWGFVYFRHDISKEDFVAFLRVLGIWDRNEYAAFLSESNDIKETGYFRQMRLVSKRALEYSYGVDIRENDGFSPFEPQKLGMVDALWAFIESENERVDSGDLMISCTLTNPDDDESDEDLCFGFLAENSDTGVCRIWSRAWVVTK